MHDNTRMYNICVCERAPPVAVPSTVCTVSITSLAREPLCTDTLTETLVALSVMVYDVASNPIVTAEERERW